MATYEHPTGITIILASLITTVLAAFAVLARLFTRQIVVHNLGLDDFLAVVALVISILLAVTIGLQVNLGLGNDAAHERDDIMGLKKFQWAGVWLYFLGFAVIKESILMQYLRIFPQRRFRVACYILMAAVLAHGIWSVLNTILICRPIQNAWISPSPEDGDHCFNRFHVALLHTGINMGTDLAICLLPLPMLKMIAAPKHVKVSLMILFSLGGLVCLISGLRFGYIYQSMIENSTWNIFNTAVISIWSIVGLNTAIICSCLPTLKACLSRMFPRVKKAFTSRKRKETFADDEDPFSSTVALTRPEPVHFYGSRASSSTKRSCDATFKESVDMSQQQLRWDSVTDVSCKIARGSMGFEELCASETEKGLSGIKVLTQIKQDVEHVPREAPARNKFSAHEWVKKVPSNDAILEGVYRIN